MKRNGFRPGEAITRDSINAKLNKPPDYRIRGPRVNTARGETVITDQEVIYMKITDVASSPARYGWKEVLQNQNTGAWEDSYRTGTVDNDPAFEVNNATLAAGSTIYRAERSRASGAWLIRSGGGGGGANTVTNPIIMILGTYDEYKNCPGAPAAPPLNTSSQPCWPAYAWAAYEICGYQYIKKFDARSYGKWAYGLNGGTASAYRRFYSAFYGDSAVDCQGVRFLEYCSQSTLSCSPCPSFITGMKCIKISFTTPARPCAYDSANVACGYNCPSAFTGMDSASAWGQTFTTTLCKGINCSFLGTVGPFTVTLNYEEIPRGSPTCDWGPSVFDPCDACYGFGRWWLCIEGPGNSSSSCSGCHFTGYFSNDQIKSIKTDCTTQSPSQIVSCNACTNGTNSFKFILENSVSLTCCTTAESNAC